VVDLAKMQYDWLSLRIKMWEHYLWIDKVQSSAFTVSWQGPEEGVVKLDVDESSVGNPTGRVGSRESYSHNCGNLLGGIYSFCRYGI